MTTYDPQGTYRLGARGLRETYYGRAVPGGDLPSREEEVQDRECGYCGKQYGCDMDCQGRPLRAPDGV